MDRRFFHWYRSTFGYALTGVVVLWAVLPPLGLWPLAWIAPIWWVLLVRRNQLTAEPAQRESRSMAIRVAMAIPRWMLDAGHPYRGLWLAGFLFWLVELHWLRYPHPATSLGWLGISFYFGFYLPVFVGLSRVAVHRLRVPVMLAAPIVWTGLELARARFLSGMSMACLGHTQYRWIELIQISDLAGAFGVSFLVMFVAACLARIIPLEGKPKTIWPLGPAVVLLAVVLVYGYLRIASLPQADRRTPVMRIALIQGNIESKVKSDLGKRDFIHKRYCALTVEAIEKYPAIDLIIWPETMFRDTLVTRDRHAHMTDEYRDRGWTPEMFQAALNDKVERSRREIELLARAFRVPMIIGVDRSHFGAGGEGPYNAAVFVDEDGRFDPDNIYNKIHLVVFGEYVPFGECFPLLKRLTPVPLGIKAGKDPVAFDTGKLKIAPNICFETILSRVIRRQINTLRDKGNEPDILANLTNDGWFRGSSELDLHLICGVFRAVECRKPLVIAANTGFSAWIDGDGRIRAQGPRRDEGTLLAEVRPDPRGSCYLDYGDWPAGLCLAACILFALLGGWQQFRARRAQPKQGRQRSLRQRGKRARKKR